MSHQLKIISTSDEQWFALQFKYSRRFTDLIRDGIKPTPFRKWVKAKNRWEIHKTKLPLAVHFGRRFFHHVNYSELPEQIQIWIVEQIEQGGWTVDVTPSPILKKQTPHQVLHLLPSAPKEVVKAAYKALVAVHHPDHGGDPDAFRAVQGAYEALLSELEGS